MLYSASIIVVVAQSSMSSAIVPLYAWAAQCRSRGVIGLTLMAFSLMFNGVRGPLVPVGIGILRLHPCRMYASTDAGVVVRFAHLHLLRGSGCWVPSGD